MAQTVKITPATGLLEFIGDNVANKPVLQHDNAGNLTLTLQATKKFTVGGNLKVNGKVTMVQQTLTDNAAITWDFNNGANAKVTLGGNRTLVISNIETGDTGLLLVTQDGTGGRTLTLPNGSAIVGGGSYVPTTTAGATDVIGVYFDGTTYWWTIGYNTVTPPLTSVGISGSDFVISNSPLTANGIIGLSLATVNSNVGTFGSASAVPVVTVNAKGLVTAVSTTAISIPTDLNSLTDVTLTSSATGQLLQYNGSQWVNWTPNYVPNTRTLSINGITYDLSANRAWTIDTVSYTSRLQHLVKAGENINKGQAVYVTSADGTNMIVSKASNTSDMTSARTMGLIDATVPTNGFANVVTEGLLAGLDTTQGTEGDPVWLGANGDLLYGFANKPHAPTHLVFIGIVTRRNQNNGEIFVKVQNGFELEELHDVDLITTVPVNGHILGYDGTLWVNKTIAGWLGFTPANDANVVHTTGNETIAGIKTFSNTTQSTSISSGAIVTSGGAGIAKNLYVGGDLNVAGNLTIGGTTTTVNAQNLTVSDNMIYLNNGILTHITNVVGNGSTVVYTTQEAHNYVTGMSVTITGVTPSAYNLSNQTITAVSTNSFTIANSATGAYSSGGTARAKSNANPDLGFAGGYNDGSYAHAGLFRDATDNAWKFFKGYTPEPDASPFIDTAHASFAYADLRAYNITGNSFVKVGGTSSQFLKADGSVDSNTYLTSGSASSLYALDANVVHRTGNETVAGIKTFTDNMFVSPTSNPAQFMLSGTNPEMYIHATSGTSRFFINRASTGNQATLMFTTGMNVVQNNAWDSSGSPLWTLGMTNNNNADSFKLAYGDIWDPSSVALEITSSMVAYFRSVPYAGGNLLATQAWVQAGYVPISRTITINGISYDLSANRSWTIAAGVSSVSAGTGISVNSTTGAVTVTNTGLLSATAGTGITVSTSNQNVTINTTALLSATAGTGITVSTSNQNVTINTTALLSATAGTGITVSTLNQNLTINTTALLSATAGTGISVSTLNQNLTINNTGLLSATAGTGISVSTSNQQVTITNTGILSVAAGNGISVSTVSGTATITNTITNNNQLTNGAGYITSAALAAYLPLSGGNMTGNIAFGSSGAGLTWAANTDGASITFESTSDGGSGGRALSNLLIALSDNGDEGVKITSAGTELLYINTSHLQYKGNTIWHSANDGSGTGLDADLLDGLHASSFIRGDLEVNYSGNIFRIYTENGEIGSNGGPVAGLQIYQPTAERDAFQTFHISGDHAVHFGLDGTTNDLFVGGWSLGAVKHRIWHAGNLTNLNQLTNGPGYITTASLSGYATQVYVNTQISNLVNGAPALLDTLDELAAALGDDANFATTITNSIAGKVAKAGDTMTGELIFSMSAPQIRFADTDHYDHWIHVNSNRFYILSDRNGDGAWETPYPLELNSENNTGYIFGNVAIHSGNIGSYALTSLPAHNHDGVYVPINPDGDGPAWSYADNNPTINGKYVGGGQRFGADGDNLTGGFLQARHLNAYDGHVNSSDGYYVGVIEYGSIPGVYDTTQVIDSAGRWTGVAIADNKIASSANWNTAYGWGNHASQSYATTTYVTTQINTAIAGKVSKSGDTMTGNLAFGATSGLGLTWGLNTDAAFIKFVSSGNQAGGSYLEIGTQDDLDEEIKFTQSGVVRFYLATDGLLKNQDGRSYIWEDGTWNIGISGNAATVTNGVYTNGSYANPAWITSLAWSKITGAPSFLTSYTETDTLSTVTGRGATTSSAVTFNGNVSVGTAASLSFGSQTRQMINLWSTGYGIGVQSSTTYFRSDSRFSWHRGGSHNDAENNPGGGTVAMTLDASSNLVVTGTLTASSIIRSGGTASQFLMADGSVSTNPGWITGYSETDTLATVTARGASTSSLITINSSDVGLKVQESGTSTAWRGRIGSFNSSADKSSFLGNYTGRAGVFGHNNALTAWDDLWVNTLGIYGQGNLYLSWNTYVKGNGNDTNYSIWHSGNDGSGSGLDADLLDGYHASGSASANTVVIRDVNGYIYGSYINTNVGVDNPSIANFITDNGDGWMRKSSIAHVRNSLGNYGGWLTQAAADPLYVNITGDSMTGPLVITGSTNGQELFAINGVNGRLFTVTDDLSNSLFSVNTIAGLPVIEAFANNTVKLGPFASPVTIDSTGSLTLKTVGSANNLKLYTEDDNSWVLQTKPDGTEVGRMGFDGFSTPSAYYTEYTVSTRSSADSGVVRRIYITNGRVLALQNLTGFTYNGENVATQTWVQNQGYLTSLPAHSHTWASITSKPATSNWNTNGNSIDVVVGMLAWKNYGDNHIIFDASRSTSPTGSAVNNTNPDINWSGTYPTLMGWNGSNTYGVRVDVARYSDSTGSVAWTNVSGRPTALSSFSNDLGNYGGFLTSESIGTGNTSGVVGAKYQINDTWLRVNSDNRQFQMYGNARTMIYRTDGNTNDHGGGAHAHIFYYGGSADANRVMIINTDGRLWSSYHGWLDSMSVNYASSAGSVAWTNVSGRPTALSQFTNDLGLGGATVTIQDSPPAGSAGKLWWESDTGKLKVYYGSAWVDATPVPDMSLYYSKAGGSINGDVTVRQTLTVVGNTLIQGVLTETSDISLKENILPLENSLDKVMKLNGVSFNKKATPTMQEIGFIAQEVEEIIPDLVTETADGIKTVSYSRVTAVLVETIKEQQAQINALTDMVNSLTKKLDNL